MKRISLLLLLILADYDINSSELTVINRYSSGDFSLGDTVHIWRKEYDSLHLFSHWEGDVKYLENTKEWLTKVIIPNKKIL